MSDCNPQRIERRRTVSVNAGEVIEVVITRKKGGRNRFSVHVIADAEYTGDILIRQIPADAIDSASPPC